MKKILLIIGVLAVTFTGLVLTASIYRLNPSGENITGNTDPTTPKNGTYEIEGTTVTLKRGFSQTEAAPGSAVKITTRYFGNEAVGDVNGDGIDDMAFILTQEGGGSGIFYYAAAALKTATGYQGTNAVFFGDRVAPQTTAINDQVIEINYTDRDPDDPMSALPSIGKTLRLQVMNGELFAAPAR